MSAEYLIRCKMTCIGGSEVGECSCTHPKDCENQHRPEYDDERRKAKIRMFAHFGFILKTEKPS